MGPVAPGTLIRWTSQGLPEDEPPQVLPPLFQVLPCPDNDGHYVMKTIARSLPSGGLQVPGRPWRVPCNAAAMQRRALLWERARGLRVCYQPGQACAGAAAPGYHAPMVNTRQVTDRRTLHFASLEGILRDVEALGAKGPPRATGNWTPGQVLQHVAKGIGYATDGFPGPKAAWPVRVMGRLIRKRTLTKPTQPGFTLPRSFRFLLPDEPVAWEDGVKALRGVIARAASRRMTHPSPVFGALSHEQWVQFHCRHAELHLSFLHPA